MKMRYIGALTQLTVTNLKSMNSMVVSIGR